MTATSPIDLCRFVPTAGSTTDWTYSATVTGYQSPALAAAVNGRLYHIRAESADLSQWEISEGAYTSSTGVFARTTVLYNSSGTGTASGQSGAGTKINFLPVPQVAIVALGEDVNSEAPQGRVTPTSGTAVVAASVAGATTLYYTPYLGRRIPINNGVRLVQTTFSELSLVTTDATKSPAAVAAGKLYDVFVWVDPSTGALTFSRGPAWTDLATRGYTLTSIYNSGILVNTSAITNGPGALLGTYVGTIWSNASSAIDFIFGDIGSGGVAAALLIWNAYNRINFGAKVGDNVPFTSTSNTVGGYHGASTMIVAFVIGAQGDTISWSFAAECSLTGAVGGFLKLGVGFGTSGFSDQPSRITYPIAQHGVVGAGNYTPPVGGTYIGLNQQSDGTNAHQFNNTGTARLNCQLWM